MAKGGFRFPPFAIPLKTTKKGTEVPFLDFPRSLVRAIAYSTSTKRDADANRTDRRGSRNTLRLFRLPYVKYSTGTHRAIRIFRRALRKPDSTVARRAFLDHLCNDNTHNGTIYLFARKRYSASCASFLHTFFWQDRKKYAAGGTVTV